MEAVTRKRFLPPRAVPKKKWIKKKIKMSIKLMWKQQQVYSAEQIRNKRYSVGLRVRAIV